MLWWSLACLLSRVQLFVIPWTVACQAPRSAEFSRQEDWSRLPFPPLGDLPHPGIEPESPALAGRFFTTEPPGKPTVCIQSPRIFITKAHFQVPSKNLGWCQESVFLNNCPQRIFRRKLDGVGCSDLTWLSTGKQCFPSNIWDRGWGVPSYMLIKLLASLRIGQSINYPVCAAVHGVTKSWTQLSNWTITTSAT